MASPAARLLTDWKPLTEVQGLFAQRKVAVLANVGTLTQPTTRTSYAAGKRPLSLYSHSDQQAQWQSSISSAAAGTGWGGRMADKVASFNAASGFPVVTSLDGTADVTLRPGNYTCVRERGWFRTLTQTPPGPLHPPLLDPPPRSLSARSF